MTNHILNPSSLNGAVGIPGQQVASGHTWVAAATSGAHTYSSVAGVGAAAVAFTSTAAGIFKIKVYTDASTAAAPAAPGVIDANFTDGHVVGIAAGGTILIHADGNRPITGIGWASTAAATAHASYFV